MRVLVHVILTAAAGVMVLPFIWLVCATFKGREDFFTYALLGRHVTLENYSALFGGHPFFRWVLNSVFVSSISTVFVVGLSSLGGFAMAKYRFWGKRVLLGVMLGTMLLPAQVLIPSSYELMYRFGWLNSYAALVIPGAVSVFGILLFARTMRGVSDELLGAGRVDGCSELRLWWEVALPVVRPMLGAFTLLTFMANWNSYLWPQIILMDEGKFTLPIGLANMVGGEGYATPYGVIMAGTLLSVLPVVVLFFVMQRDFIAGLSSGAVKG